MENPEEQKMVLNNLYKDLTFEFGTRIADLMVSDDMLRKIAKITLGDEIIKVASFKLFFIRIISGVFILF